MPSPPRLTASALHEVSFRTEPPLSRGRGELVCGVASEPYVLSGAFQRPAEPAALHRRSGGPAVNVGEGTIYVGLRLATADALLPCAPSQIVNRYVRPLLRALTKIGKPASYFGRDWVSMLKTPVAWVGFAHNSETGEALFEAFVSVNMPFAEPRESFLGKVPTALSVLLGRAIDSNELAVSILEAYLAEYGKHLTVLESVAAGSQKKTREPLPAWLSVVNDAIGEVCAGTDSQGLLRIGGDLMVSEDAVRRFEHGVRVLGADPKSDAVVELARSVFLDPKIALVGARAESIAYVTSQALRSLPEA